MTILRLAFCILLLSGLLFSGCAPVQVQPKKYSEPLYNNEKQIKQKTVPLSIQLDQLYHLNRNEWQNKMQYLVLSGKDEIADRHLVQAIYSFNRLKDRKVCLEAAYLYLKKKAKSGGGIFQKDDRQLFSKFIEYTLRNPDAFDITRINVMCKNIQDNICDELR